MKIALTAISILLSTILLSQPGIKLLESGKRVSIRGLSVVNDQIVWASGSNGSVARSVDGGTSWSWTVVPGYEKRDFRDIEAFDENTAVIMGVAEPGIILQTKDGGKTWRKVYEDTTRGMFLDAMDFGSAQKGIVIGDPIGDKVYLASSEDNGDSWKKMEHGKNFPEIPAREGEAFFASSGTNVQWVGKHPIIVSGGKSSRIFWKKQWTDLPIMQGKESTGANSIAVYDNRYSVVVGGDFTKDTIRSQNCVLVTLKPTLRLRQPVTSPHGYRSCVIFLTKNKLLTCGTSGIDLSEDGGNNWTLISRESFHVCQKAKNGTAVFLAGGNGRIAKLIE